ncbi:hypothetical protein H0H92_007397 [Tricholoma furcatifolium]|nr:hypothetical protein H0H92_007397 [Tricholoma furcatifolium]
MGTSKSLTCSNNLSTALQLRPLQRFQSPVFPTPLASIYPIGTGADGETTYQEDLVASVTGQVDYSAITVNGVVTETAYTTILATVNPMTLPATIVADSTHLVYSQGLNSAAILGGYEYEVIEECTFNATTGSCVEEVVLVDSSASHTQTTSWSGSVVPFFTVVETGAPSSTTSTKANGSASRSRLLNEACAGLGIIFGLLSGAFLVL